MEVYVLKDLADCWAECPRADTLAEPPVLSEDHIRKADHEFLHSIGVRFS